jgi:hypothetical protein
MVDTGIMTHHTEFKKTFSEDDSIDFSSKKGSIHSLTNAFFLPAGSPPVSETGYDPLPDSRGTSLAGIINANANTFATIGFLRFILRSLCQIFVGVAYAANLVLIKSHFHTDKSIAEV